MTHKSPKQTTTARRTPQRFGWAASTLAMSLLAVLVGCAKPVSDSRIRTVTLSDVRVAASDTANQTLFIDARPDAAAGAGIPGSVRLLPDEARRQAERGQLAAYKRVIVYGQNAGSVRARALVKELMKAGLDDVFLFEGGYDVWSTSR